MTSGAALNVSEVREAAVMVKKKGKCRYIDACDFGTNVKGEERRGLVCFIFDVFRTTKRGRIEKGR